jgi:hypothetical protein
MADEAFESQTRLNRSYSIAAMDEKLQEVTEGISEKFSEKFHRMESNINDIRELLLNLQQPLSASPQRSSRAVEEKKFTKQHSLAHPPRQSMQSEQAEYHYEDANFRHKDTMQSDLPSETTTPVVPFYRRRSSLPTNVDPYHRENTIVRSVADIDPIKSGVLLTTLDTFHVYKWYKDLIKLQKKHPYDQLHWSSFISTAATMRINAFNVAHNFIRRTIMDGRELILENTEMMELILEIILPRTEQEWMEDFKKLVNFKKLARNQHEIPPDTSRFDEWYMGIMEIIWDANEVYDFLSSIHSRNHSPTMKSYSGKPGLMQTFYELIPMGTGKYIHSQISYLHLDQKDLTFEEYTKRFQEQNQKFQDASDAVKHNRAKMNSSDLKTGMDIVKKPFISNTFNNKNVSNSYANNNKNTYDNNNQNDNNKQITPYNNPYHKKLNNMYNDDYDELDNYDLDEVYGNRNESIEGLNPGSDVTTYLSSLDRELSILPCHAELEGKCEPGGKPCRYSHDPHILQREWKLKMDRLQASKYRNTIKAPASPYTPLYPPQVQKRDTPLRAITAEEEGKVSIINNTQTNDITYSNNDREGNVTFAIPPDNFSTDSNSRGDNRGQQYL